ncbi:MAG: DUF1570 domain-containing protein [Pirellulaceae bacterium]
MPRCQRIYLIPTIASAAFCMIAGCQSLLPFEPWKSEAIHLPGNVELHSDFSIPTKHRFLKELETCEKRIENWIEISDSNETIHLELFEDRDRFAKFVRGSYPEFDDRRAFFVKTDTRLTVYANWGERVLQDMRHEMTHAYLHRSYLNIPLWLDEGLAEFFETTFDENGRNEIHIVALSKAFREEQWIPNLRRLELIDRPEMFGQTEYAEAWLWVHFLLTHSEATRELVQRKLNSEEPSEVIVSAELLSLLPDVQVQLVEHLNALAKSVVNK